MGQPRVKWGQAERYFKRHGYKIRPQGGDKIVTAPPNTAPNSRHSVRVGHTSCNSAGTELLKVYLSQFKNVFGVSIGDIVED